MTYFIISNNTFYQYTYKSYLYVNVTMLNLLFKKVMWRWLALKNVKLILPSKIYIIMHYQDLFNEKLIIYVYTKIIILCLAYLMLTIFIKKS